MAKKRVFQEKIYYTAVFNGRKYTETTTGWSKILDCNMSRLSRALKKHYSMQAVLDEEFAQQQEQHRLHRLFCFGGVRHA